MDRLPDFIFCRDKTAEEAGGFILAGTLVTDTPKLHRSERRRELHQIAEVIERLLHEVERDPELQEASIGTALRLPP